VTVKSSANMAMKGFATNPMVRYVPLCRI